MMMNKNSIPKFLREAEEEDSRFFVQFGGQGGYFLSELERLTSTQNCMGSFIDASCDAIRDLFERPDVRDERSRVYPHWFHLRDWLRGRNIPPEEAMSGCQISFAGILITQLAHLWVLQHHGFSPDEWARFARASTGHSQGIAAAVAFGLQRQGHDFLQVTYDFVYWLAFAGFYVAANYKPPQVSDTAVKCPMTAIFGLRLEELSEVVNNFNTSKGLHLLDISLQNGEKSIIVTGHPGDMLEFRKSHREEFVKRGLLWTEVAVTAPFHNERLLREITENIIQDKAVSGLSYHGSDLRIPVITFTDGSNLQTRGTIPAYLTEIMLTKPLNWLTALRPLIEDDSITHVIDFGPGQTSASFTKAAAGSREFTILNAASRAGLARLLTNNLRRQQ